MNTSAEAADQVVRMSLNGAEAALKITGSGAKEVAKLLFKALKDLSKQSKKTKGQMRLSNLVKSGKKLDIYQVSDANLKRFCEQAKKYGMLYTVLKDRNKNDGITEVMVKAEDKAKVDRIFEKLGLVPENVADVYPEKAQEKEYDVEHRRQGERRRLRLASPLELHLENLLVDGVRPEARRSALRHAPRPPRCGAVRGGGRTRRREARGSRPRGRRSS